MTAADPYAPEYGQLGDWRFRHYVWTLHGGVCGGCGEPVALEEMQLDHILPRTKGGTDHVSNLRPAHRRCNVAKGNGDRGLSRPPAGKTAGGISPADLRHARGLLGMTYRSLAEALGVPTSTIWRWETGKHPIERPRMLSLALHALAEMRDARTAPDDREDPEF